MPFIGKPITRRRDISFPLGRRRQKSVSNTGSVTYPYDGDIGTIYGTQVTVSEGHPWQSRTKGSLQDTGGEFFSQKKYVEGKKFSPYHITILHEDVAPMLFWHVSTYDGPLYPVNPLGPDVSWPLHGSSSNSLLDVLGATAVARCKPTNSVADASVFLGELFLDGLPHLVGARTWKDRTSYARSAGDEYLNYQFGWRPLISDVNSFAYAVDHANTVLTQYERDSGKAVRRRYNFPTKVTTTENTVYDGAYPYGTNSDFIAPPASRGRLVRTVETVQRKWFSGSFTYHLPDGKDYRSQMIRGALESKKLLGLSLTPDTLWNLAPWSWAVDWFSNTGDVVSNLTDWATDGLVMHYGYMMEHTIVKHTYSLTKPGLLGPELRVRPLTFVIETKIRRKANPFGFGLTWEGLSPSQLAVLAALGLSRS